MKEAWKALPSLSVLICLSSAFPEGFWCYCYFFFRSWFCLPEWVGSSSNWTRDKDTYNSNKQTTDKNKSPSELMSEIFPHSHSHSHTAKGILSLLSLVFLVVHVVAPSGATKRRAIARRAIPNTTRQQALAIETSNRKSDQEKRKAMEAVDRNCLFSLSLSPHLFFFFARKRVCFLLLSSPFVLDQLDRALLSLFPTPASSTWCCKCWCDRFQFCCQPDVRTLHTASSGSTTR